MDNSLDLSVEHCPVKRRIPRLRVLAIKRTILALKDPVKDGNLTGSCGHMNQTPARRVLGPGRVVAMSGHPGQDTLLGSSGDQRAGQLAGVAT